MEFGIQRDRFSSAILLFLLSLFLIYIFLLLMDNICCQAHKYEEFPYHPYRIDCQYEITDTVFSAVKDLDH